MNKLGTTDKDLVYYMSLPYTIVLRPDEEGDFIARVQELPGCSAHGSDRNEALDNLQDIQQAWIEECLESGQQIPEPEPEEELPSGKWVQRVPRTLHKKLTELARKEGVSLNQLATSILSEATGLARRGLGVTPELKALTGSASALETHSSWESPWAQPPGNWVCVVTSGAIAKDNITQRLGVVHKLVNQSKDAYDPKEIAEHSKKAPSRLVRR